MVCPRTTIYPITASLSPDPLNQNFWGQSRGMCLNNILLGDFFCGESLRRAKLNVAMDEKAFCKLWNIHRSINESCFCPAFPDPHPPSSAPCSFSSPHCFLTPHGLSSTSPPPIPIKLKIFCLQRACALLSLHGSLNNGCLNSLG